jgi:hypothetical protein
MLRFGVRRCRHHWDWRRDNSAPGHRRSRDRSNLSRYQGRALELRGRRARPWLATCSTKRGDISAWLIREGLGLTFIRYSSASREILGLLTEEYKPTEERTLPAAIHFAIAPEAVASAATAVARANSRVRHQGNISSSYERIYHVPGQRYYDKTQMNEGKGERWFCSEQEAVGAGWRKAKVYAAAGT